MRSVSAEVIRDVARIDYRIREDKKDEETQTRRQSSNGESGAGAEAARPRSYLSAGVSIKRQKEIGVMSKPQRHTSRYYGKVSKTGTSEYPHTTASAGGTRT